MGSFDDSNKAVNVLPARSATLTALKGNRKLTPKQFSPGTYHLTAACPESTHERGFHLIEDNPHHDPLAVRRGPAALSG